MKILEEIFARLLYTNLFDMCAKDFHLELISCYVSQRRVICIIIQIKYDCAEKWRKANFCK